jgi:F0F1-type ATP synthase assembly protein I
MILYNKLIRIDLLILIAVVLLFVVRNEFLHGALQGALAVLVVGSIFNHIAHYKRTGNLYK